jgi:phosphatidylglycerophosphate synthase
MQTPLRKENIPWLMAAVRALLGPVVIVGQTCQWSGITLAALIVTALLSDICDGILARHWHCDTAAVRLFDSMADTVFYICTTFALWRSQPLLFQRHALLLSFLLGFETLRFAFDFAKFGKPASYHSYLAKAWGLLLATSVIICFATPHGEPSVVAALIVGILCDLEGLTMSIILPIWQRDVKTLRQAWQARHLILAPPVKNELHATTLQLSPSSAGK